MRLRVKSHITRLAIRAILSVIPGSSPVTAAMNEPVRTEAGLVSEAPAQDPSITVYKGIPFAALPVGDLRWRARQPPIPCPQTRRSPTASMSEDCLFLNIRSERRPSWSGSTVGAYLRRRFGAAR
jgi:hypothetical protein